jgi:hypothetical protein
LPGLIEPSPGLIGPAIDPGAPTMAIRALTIGVLPALAGHPGGADALHHRPPPHPPRRPRRRWHGGAGGRGVRGGGRAERARGAAAVRAEGRVEARARSPHAR